MSHLRTLVVAVCGVVTIAGPVGPATAATGQGRRARSPMRTGGADATADLQALIDGTPDGGVVQLEPGGNYRVEGTLVLEDRHDLRIEGNGARIFATTTGGHRSQPDPDHRRLRLRRAQPGDRGRQPARRPRRPRAMSRSSRSSTASASTASPTSSWTASTSTTPTATSCTSAATRTTAAWTRAGVDPRLDLRPQRPAGHRRGRRPRRRDRAQHVHRHAAGHRRPRAELAGHGGRRTSTSSTTRSAPAGCCSWRPAERARSTGS